MAIIKITASIKETDSTELQHDNGKTILETFYIDLKHKMLWTTNSHIIRMPFTGSYENTSESVNKIDKTYMTNLERFFCNELGYPERFDIHTRNNPSLYAYSIDPKKINDDYDAITEMTFDGKEEHYGAYKEGTFHHSNNKRIYFKNFLEQMEIGKPLVFFKDYNDPAFKKEYSQVALAGNGGIGLYNVENTNMEEYYYKKGLRNAFMSETILLKCKEIESIEFITIDREVGLYSSTLKDLTTEILDSINKNDMGDRLNLERIRQTTYSAIATKKDKYNNATNYDARLKNEINRYKAQKNNIQNSINRMDKDIENTKHMSLSERLFKKNDYER